MHESGADPTEDDMHGFSTAQEPVEGCTFCPQNQQLHFEPTILEGADAYTVPFSLRVAVTHAATGITRFFWVPMPLTSLLVALYHTTEVVLTDLVDQIAQPPGAGTGLHIFPLNHYPGRHPRITVIRGELPSAKMPKVRTMALAVHRARQRTGLVPPDEMLAELWSQAGQGPKKCGACRIGEYHRLILQSR